MATQIYLGMPPPKIKEWIMADAERKYQEMLKTPLHFTANEDGSSVSLVCYDNQGIQVLIDPWCKLDYSMDGKSWQTYIDPDSEDEELHRGKDINLNKGETVYFKATLGKVDENPNLNGFTYYDENKGFVTKYHHFEIEGSIKADGNIQFLLENTGTEMKVPAHCYYYMFDGCTSLIKAPTLPATTLAEKCYSNMFSSCTSLTKAPALPATNLAAQCYYSMFSHCTSLIKAPTLPATTLVDECYSYMFNGCTALTQTPALLAETLGSYCCSYMFYGCTNINSINVNFSAWKPANATNSWVSNVSSSGTFTCPEGLPEQFGNNRIPTGWTVVRK